LDSYGIRSFDIRIPGSGGDIVLANAYKIAGSDIVSESFDGDIVVLDLKSGKYFGFTDAGSGIWEALAAGVAPEILLSAEAGCSRADFELFLEKLLDHQLLAVREDATAHSTPDELLEKIRSAKEKPDLFVFDDLADLFKADPIHDVEEPAGWPVVKKD
jgi:hypothetical protein